MKKLSIFSLLLVSCLAQAQSDDNPGSLWSNESKNFMLDRVAAHEGDLVTVIINETSASSFSASTTTAKNDSNSITKGLGPILGNLIPDLSTGAKASSSGQGSTSQTGKFSARMTVMIKKVLANGTLLIEGTRQVKVNKDIQMLKLTGMIRKDDIRSDNTVLSSSIADAQIYGDGKGQIVDRQRRGILTRVLDWLF